MARGFLGSLCSLICKENSQQLVDHRWSRGYFPHRHAHTYTELSHWLSKPVIDELILRRLKHRSEGAVSSLLLHYIQFFNLASGWSTANAGESHPLPSLNLWNIDYSFFLTTGCGKTFQQNVHVIYRTQSGSFTCMFFLLVIDKP